MPKLFEEDEMIICKVHGLVHNDGSGNCSLCVEESIKKEDKVMSEGNSHSNYMDEYEDDEEE